MRSKAIVQCPACGDNSWRFVEASYVRALLEEGDKDLIEGAGIVRVSCATAGTWRSSTPRRWASEVCGTKGEACEREGCCALGVGGQKRKRTPHTVVRDQVSGGAKTRDLAVAREPPPLNRGRTGRGDMGTC